MEERDSKEEKVELCRGSGGGKREGGEEYVKEEQREIEREIERDKRKVMRTI